MGEENRSRLASALDRLPVEYRQVIEIRSIQRQSFTEVGDRMGRSEDAAGKLWYRAIEKLRNELTSSEDSGIS